MGDWHLACSAQFSSVQFSVAEILMYIFLLLGKFETVMIKD